MIYDTTIYVKKETSKSDLELIPNENDNIILTITVTMDIDLL